MTSQNKKGITVLSLFDGMSGMQIALDKLGVKVDNYISSEIDKFAIKVTQANFPSTQQIGDVKSVSVNYHVDLISMGSPCQDLSRASNTKLGLDGERSGLFFEGVRIIKEALAINPNLKVLVENVRMSKANQDRMSEALSEALGQAIEPIAINSSLFSAQNRYRLYFTNLKVGELPEDKGIVLQDILEENYVADRQKSFCLDANFWKGGSLKTYFEKNRRQICFSKDGLALAGLADLKGMDCIKRVYFSEGKAPCLTTSMGGHREPKVYVKDLKWRKLTPNECEALQTVPRGYTDHVSPTQRYKMLGNGFTIDVIAFLLEDFARGV